MGFGITRNSTWDIDGDDYEETPDITHHHFNLITDNDDNDENDENGAVQVIGNLSLYVIDLFGDDLFEQFDTISGELHEFNKFSRTIDPCDNRFIAYITHVEIDPEYRGYDRALLFINGVINIISKETSATMAILKPYPIIDRDDLFDENLKKNIKIGITKLKKHYAKIGFKPLNRNYMGKPI